MINLLKVNNIFSMPKNQLNNIEVVDNKII